MKHIILLIISILVSSVFIKAQNNSDIISEIKNDEVIIRLHKLIDFSDIKEEMFVKMPKDDHKYYVAEISMENISSKEIDMGGKYTIYLTLKDAKGNEYKSGLKGMSIVSYYNTQKGKSLYNKKSNDLCWGSSFPAKTKARTLLCGFEVPKDAKLTSFGISKYKLWNTIK
ncbi:MAG: hypothetical protein HXY49_05435 [Ignavibacteriaceae bacterium]|nr:hypothetical protein [Ignavibacteriaceae bacterium]